METGRRMFGKGQPVSVPGKLSEEDSLFGVCEDERLGRDKGEKRGSRSTVPKMLRSSCFPLWGSALGVLCEGGGRRMDAWETRV